MARRRILIAILLTTGLLSCGGRRDTRDADVLLFAGKGTSPNDVRAFETLLAQQGASYTRIDSAALDALSVDELRAHRLIIIPGGNFEQMGQGLAPATTANVRIAVQQGLNYLGVCAGAFMAGNSPYNGINLTGLKFRFHPISSLGVRKAAVTISTADGQTLDHYWEDGPELSGWGMVVAKYPDGAPAVAQGYVGYGWVVLSGIHAEAPEDWREGMTFKTPASESNAHAMRILEAALNGAALAHY
jgi:glutamine amidotransferase-like uncharacterized protein